MKLGLSIPQVGVNATRENALKLAQAAEKENFESLWVQERILWPINPQSKYPATPDGSLREEYQHNLDSMNLLSYIAANTSKILLGTGIAVSAYHLPVRFAKEVATVDILSQGRFVCGIGLGWSKDEYQTSNVPFEKRGARQDEFIQAIKKVWTDDTVEFNGEFYNIPASKIEPKPVQKPHPKILLAGFGPKTFERITNYADETLDLVERQGDGAARKRADGELPFGPDVPDSGPEAERQADGDQDQRCRLDDHFGKGEGIGQRLQENNRNRPDRVLAENGEHHHAG